ncbi:hypothetical protein YC2023_038506 [Brassica napus]
MSFQLRPFLLAPQSNPKTSFLHNNNLSTGGTVTYTHQPRPPSSIVHFSATNSSMESEILLASTVSPSPTSMLADAFEIHSLFGCRADRVRFSAKSSQLGLCTLDVAYGSRASHRKLLPVNISTRCINVVFDYHLGEQSPWNKKKHLEKHLQDANALQILFAQCSHLELLLATMFSVMFSDLTSGGGREVGKGAATPYEINTFSKAPEENENNGKIHFPPKTKLDTCTTRGSS